MDNEALAAIKRTLPWLRFLGWFYAVAGGLGSLVLVGVPFLIMGIFLIAAAGAGEELVRGGPQRGLARYHDRLRGFFLTLGVSTLVGAVVLGVILCFYALLLLVFGAAVVHAILESQ